MSFIASYAHTLAGARATVFDEGINIAPWHKTRRERVIELARQWQIDEQARQEARRREKEAFREVIQRAKRKHRRVKPYEPGNNGSHPSVIVSMVAAWHEVDEQELYSRTRRASVVDAKHDAIAAVYLNCKIDGRRYSLTELGRVFGIDHTTVHHALRKRGLK